MTDIPRIGRRALPGEGTIALMRESPEVLDSMAMLTWCEANGLGHTLDAANAWAALPADEREAWRDRVFAESSDSARAYDAANPEPPPEGPSGGGEPLPIARIA